MDVDELEVIRDIAPGDQMYEYAPHWYFRAGPVAVRFVERAREIAGVDPPQRILDFACGHGRVLRTLRATYPDAEITACDVALKPIRFCAEKFGAIPLQSDDDPRQIRLGRYDLIWCGSLLTHIDAHRCRLYLDLFCSALAPGGLLVFTTQGRLSVDGRLRVRVDPHGLTEQQIENVLRDYDESGYGFAANLIPERNIGQAFCSPTWICGELGQRDLDLLLYTESGWGEERDEWAQDVVACTPTTTPFERASDSQETQA